MPNGSGGVNGCATGISVSTNNGVSFPFRGHAVVCPQSGAGLCFPDQEHIAADRVNDIRAASVAHASLLNKLDSFMTMQQLAKGDVADIIQNVRWQKDLYATLPPLAQLGCSASLVDASQNFIDRYGRRQVHNRDYPALLQGLSQCFGETARLPQAAGLGLGRELAEIERNAGDLAALQKAHREYLLKLQRLGQ